MHNTYFGTAKQHCKVYYHFHCCNCYAADLINFCIHILYVTKNWLLSHEWGTEVATVVYRTSTQVRVRLLQVGLHWPLKLQVIGLIMVTKQTNRRGWGLVLSSKLLPIMKIDLCNSGPIQQCWKNSTKIESVISE